MLHTRTANDKKRPYRLAKATAPRFRKALQRAELKFTHGFDEAQRAAIAQLSTPPARGFYLWGEVGRGKSMLTDLFYDSVPTARKQRFHFHNFFRDLQADIFVNRRPIEETLRSILGPAEVVFFDEFHVHDVADAVYLTKTLEALIELNVLVLATSNYAPAELMPDPLFHDRFLPAIALIESQFEVVPLGHGADYRRLPSAQPRTGFGAGEWRVGQPVAAITPHDGVELELNGLPVRAAAVSDTAVSDYAISREPVTESVATFAFAELCERPLGTTEYLRLAERFDRIELVDVPDLAAASRNALMRLSNLVDVLYHRDQRFDVRALSEPERMRDAGDPPADVARTLSRLATLSLT